MKFFMHALGGRKILACGFMLLLVPVFLLLSFLASCTEEENKPQRLRVAVLMFSGADPFMFSVSEKIQHMLSSTADVVLLDADNRQMLQEDQLAEVLKQGVDALAINPVETGRVGIMLEKISAASVPVIFYNREPDTQQLKKYGKAVFVGTEAQQAGVLQGDIIKRLWETFPGIDRNGDKVLQYVMLQGNADSPEALERTEYSVRRAVEQGVAMRQVGPNLVCNWDKMEGYEAMRMTLEAQQRSVELVISNNDAMALGAVEALQELGFNLGPDVPTIPVIGVDAIDDALASIRKGHMTATVRQDGDGMAKAVSDMVLNSLAGKEFLQGTALNWDKTGVCVRIPYSLVN